LSTSSTGLLLDARSDHTTGSRNIKPEVVFKMQKMARYASFCQLIISPFNGEVPVFARLWPISVRVRVSFTTGAVRSAILATAGLLVYLMFLCNYDLIKASFHRAFRISIGQRCDTSEIAAELLTSRRQWPCVKTNLSRV